MKKVLVATVKPFASEAVDGIRAICEENGYEFILLENYGSQEDLHKAVEDVDALIIRSDQVDADVIAAAKKLKIVVRAGAGYDNVDLKAASAKHIVVMNTPGQNSNAVAELALGMMVYMARGKFNGKPGTELKGKTLGIHAYGNVGRNIRRIAQGFDMKVLAYDPIVSTELIRQDGVQPMNTHQEMYRMSDYVSINLPLIPATRGIIDYAVMMSMPKGASLVNTARKEVINEDDLLKVMEERDDLYIASDIEPDCAETLMEKYPDRCYFTPKKMGAQTLEANSNAGIAAIKQIGDFFEKGDTTFKVN